MGIQSIPAYILLDVSYRPAGGGAATLVRLATHNQPAAAAFAVVDWEQRLDQPLQFERSMFGSRRTRGDVEIGTGTVSAGNGNGGLDYLNGASFDDLRVVLSVNDYPVPAGSDEILSADRDGPQYVETGELTEDRLTLYLRDGSYKLRQPALPTRYLGNNSAPNGVEGDSDLLNIRKPRAVGAVFNAAPVQVNKQKLVYQVDGQTGLNTGWTLVVKDMGVVLTAGSVYANQADLETNAPTPGQYRVWPAGGCFRLGATASGKVTTDVYNPQPATVGSSTATPTITLPCQFHVLARRLAADAGLLNDPSQQIVDGFALAAAPEAGVFLTGDITYLEALNLLCKAANATWSVPLTGATVGTVGGGGTATTMYLYQLSTTGAINLTADRSEVHDLRLVPSADENRGKPIWKVTVRWGRNWSPMSDSEVAGSARTGTVWTRLLSEWQESTVSDASVKTTWPNAGELVVETSLTNATDATAEANRLLTLYKVWRSMYEIDLPLEYFLRTSTASPARSHNLGDMLTLTYPRLDLAAGKVLQIIGKSVSAQDGLFTLTLWG